MEEFDSESRKKTYIITSACSELSTLQVCIREVSLEKTRPFFPFTRSHDHHFWNNAPTTQWKDILFEALGELIKPIKESFP